MKQHLTTLSGPEKLPFSRLALAGSILAVLAALAAVLSGLGTRWGWWHFRTGFLILRWAVVAGMAGMIACIGAAVITKRRTLHRGFLLSIMGGLIAIPVTVIPLGWFVTVYDVPRIHDITTDMVNPPEFRAVIPLRADATNPVEYGGAEIAEQQQKAYPDVKPLMLPVPQDKAFETALAAAKEMGWRIVEASPQEGRIEATDTTFWFGFKDDVVVRVMPEDSESRIDVRSLSRVGISDVGTNANRIVKYLKRLETVQDKK